MYQLFGLEAVQSTVMASLVHLGNFWNLILRDFLIILYVIWLINKVHF